MPAERVPCQRCSGRVWYLRDAYGQLEGNCVNCGHVTYPGQRVALTKEEEQALMRRFGGHGAGTPRL